MRHSELTRLTAGHIDLEHDLIEAPGRKSAASRRQIPIEKSLRPLLQQLVRERPHGPLLPLPAPFGHNGAADLLRSIPWLMAVAGHADPRMTKRYTDEAAIVRMKFGTPHPPLPPVLLRAGIRTVARGSAVAALSAY